MNTEDFLTLAFGATVILSVIYAARAAASPAPPAQVVVPPQAQVKWTLRVRVEVR